MRVFAWLSVCAAACCAAEFEPVEPYVTVVSQGWGKLGVDTAVVPPDREPRSIVMGGKTYEKGLGTHADSRIVVDLWGEFARFRAEAGLQDQPSPHRGSVVFQVLVDGEKRFDSGVMRQDSPVCAVDVDVSGAQEMVLVVTNGGDNITSDVANWANAELERGGAGGGSGPRPGFDIAPFAQVCAWAPAQKELRPGRVEELDVDQIFPGTILGRGPDGAFGLEADEEGVAAIGLQWHENRYVRELSVAFAADSPVPSVEGARVEWWVGESPWQGAWEPLEGQIEADGRVWRVTVSRKDVRGAHRGVPKVRWVFACGDKPVRVEELTAVSCSLSEDTALVVRHRDGAGRDAGRVSVYNGAIVSPSESPLDWSLDEPLELRVQYLKTRPGFAKSDRTTLRFALPSGAFGVAVEDVVEKGYVYVPDFGLLVSAPSDGTTFEQAASRADERKSVLQRVRAMPDQTFAQAMEHVHRPVQNNGPTMLSLACDNHKFIVEESGQTTYRFDPEIDPQEDRRKAVASPQLRMRVTPDFGAGGLACTDRHLEDGWYPLVTTHYEDGGVRYTQRCCVAPSAGTGTGVDSAWLDEKPLFFAVFSMKNAGQEAAEGSIALTFLSDVKGKGPAKVELADGGTKVLANGNVIAYLAGADGKWTCEDGGKAVVTASLAPGQVKECCLYIPAWPVAGGEPVDFPDGRALEARVRAYWEAILGEGAHVSVPEPLLQDVILASQVHCYMAARNEANGQRVSAWCASDRYGPLESESQAIIHGMGLMGHDAFAQRSLDFFINRYNEDGLLTTGYTLMGMGWHLWTLAEFFARTQDREWFEGVAPRLEEACAWIMRDREKTKRLGPDGGKLPEYGLMSPGVAADWSRFAYRIRPQAEFYAGFKGIAEAYSAIGRPEGAAMLEKAAEFRDEIRRAYDWTQACSPVVELGNDTWIPYCPAFIGGFGRVMDIYPNEDGGRSWGKDMSMGAHNLVVLGVLGEDDRRSVEWITNYLEDFWCVQSGMGAYTKEENRADWFNLGGFSKVQPYYTRLVEVYALMDDVKPFIRSYLNAIPSLLNVENLTLWEHFNNGGAWNKTHETGWFLAQTRLMLVMERGRALWLAPFVTNGWMQDGMAVEAGDVQTYFGDVSFRIESHVSEGYIEATVEPPRREAPEAIFLRLRHPDSRKMAAVEVDGQSHADFDADRECIRLEAGGGDTIRVRALY